MSKRIPQKLNHSLLRALGGDHALDCLIGAFYFNVLHDPLLAGFFTHSDFESVLRHQRQFLAIALSDGSISSDAYDGRDLHSAHRNLVVSLGLNHNHFDRMLAILRATLHQLGHGSDLSERICQRVEALRMVVLGALPNPNTQPPRSGDQK